MEEVEICVLGGGIAGLSVGYFSKEMSIKVLEKDDTVGGLARTLDYGENTTPDIGPHIIFSKDKEILDFMVSLTEMNQIRRSNMVLYHGEKVQYPFENFLGMVKDKEAVRFAVDSFLKNPYKNYDIQNMLQFFLSKFGEGITRMYLQPYNEKIWKMDPSFMDTQMVDRIPNPPHEDIVEGSKGNYKEGYLHQLHFYYPKSGGIQSLVKGLAQVLKAKKGENSLKTGEKILSVHKDKESWIVKSQKGEYRARQIINCMPIHEFVKILDIPDKQTLLNDTENLKYNSIKLFTIGTREDLAGDHYAFNIPDKDVIFHRISKLDFLGENYISKNPEVKASFLAEVTYREGDYYSTLSDEKIKRFVTDGLKKIGFIKEEKDIVFNHLHTEKYAYVIYDLPHKATQAKVMSTLEKDYNIYSAGRFAQFLYLNMDQVIEEAKKTVQKIGI